MDWDHHFLTGVAGVGIEPLHVFPKDGCDQYNSPTKAVGALSIELRDALRPHDGIRTRISPLADIVGFEPTPDRLTADRSNH